MTASNKVFVLNSNNKVVTLIHNHFIKTVKILQNSSFDCICLDIFNQIFFIKFVFKKTDVIGKNFKFMFYKIVKSNLKLSFLGKIQEISSDCFIIINPGKLILLDFKNKIYANKNIKEFQILKILFFENSYFWLLIKIKKTGDICLIPV